MFSYDKFFAECERKFSNVERNPWIVGDKISWFTPYIEVQLPYWNKVQCSIIRQTCAERYYIVSDRNFVLRLMRTESAWDEVKGKVGAWKYNTPATWNCRYY